MTEEGYTCEQGSGGLVAPSGAASSTHASLTYGQSLPVQVDEWVVSKGVDPRTDQATLMTGGDPKTDHATSGGDPETDHATSGGDPETDHAFLGETGGDPKTDLATFGAGAFSVDNGSSPREGELASQTAHLFSWTQLILLRQSALNFVMDCRVQQIWRKRRQVKLQLM